MCQRTAKIAFLLEFINLSFFGNIISLGSSDKFFEYNIIYGNHKSVNIEKVLKNILILTKSINFYEDISVFGLV